MPTILDWLDRPAPRACDGRSLLPLVRGAEPADWRQEVYFEHDFRTVVTQRAEKVLGIASDECSYAVVRDRRYKYVHFAALPPLLFDLEADPHETTNLATRPEMAATVLRYAQKMLDWRLSHADRTLTNMALTKDGVFSRA
jgi:arylsulfatase A-like enzyme